jgi:hypothetical protein
MAVRRFVLAPVAEVAPAAVDPLTGRSIRELLANLDRRPSCLALCGPHTTALSRALVDSLSAVGLFESTGSDRWSEVETHDLDDSRWRESLAWKTRELHADRWSAEIWGDRWIVTDFWFDLLDQEARRLVLPPTFLVATHPSTYWQLRRRLDPNPIGREVPILWPGGDEAITRLPDRDLDADDAGPDQANLDRMKAEILAACAASRAGP